MSQDPYIEPIYYHDDVNGWHHHHSEAGAMMHLDVASGHTTDTDGRIIIYSGHMADHDSNPNVDDVCLNDRCEFAALHPETEEWIIREVSS